MNEFDLAVSYASEQRDYVERFVKYVKDRKIKVFYDRDEPERLLGAFLPEELDKIFREERKYCVIFLSKEYAAKEYTRLEARSAIAHSLSNEGKLIIFKFDTVDFPGINTAIGYASIADYPMPEAFADVLISKMKSSSRKENNNKADLKRIFKIITDHTKHHLELICRNTRLTLRHERETSRTLIKILDMDHVCLYFQMEYDKLHNRNGNLLISILPFEPCENKNIFNASLQLQLDSKSKTYVYCLANKGLFKESEREKYYSNIDEIVQALHVRIEEMLRI